MKFSCSFPKGYHELKNSLDDQNIIFVIDKGDGDPVVVMIESRISSPSEINGAINGFLKRLKKEGVVILEPVHHKRDDGYTYAVLHTEKKGNPVMAAVITMLGDFFIVGISRIRKDNMEEKLNDMSFLFESLTVDEDED